ncbi:hypothetical protein CK477_22250 [Enterobacter cloacae]|nr:hypothetical protein CK477_22250 [Enterobacter cloacae]
MLVIFAIGIALDLPRDKYGSVSQIGFIAYLIHALLPKPVALFRDMYLDYEQQAFSHINNLFSGILTGVHNRFSRVLFQR